ncbi:hypothetical protein GG804_14010 [Sphingomonas histidinilytica]|uniref:hypothetical protein n=1 Tax=Rhizorhabdus histidinilytica TaxID=439228 RepID=UPI001ADA240B|nr:hypothetical protein [Rhizorhabdus histidinilytica]MBO9377884.1 hypothetical protein [Rhizorhabdus histidinilytica]
MHQHLSESSQHRADRLLAEFQAERSGAAPIARASRWRRIRRALRPWVAGFDNPYMDALWLAFMLYFVALNVAFAAMWIADHQAPPTSGAFSADEVASRPAAIPLGGGATGEGR